MAKNRIRVTILGNEYVVLTEVPEQQVMEMAAEVEEQINSCIEASPSLSSSMASMLTALNFCDEKMKAERATDHLRGQINEYMREAQNSRDLVKQAKEMAEASAAEAQRLREELQALHTQMTEEIGSVRHSAQIETEEARLEAERVRAEMVDLRNRLVDETKAVVAQIQREMADAKAELQRMEEENQSLKNQLSGEVRSESEQMEALQAENAALQARQQELKNELESARVTNFDTEQLLSELQQQYEVLQRKIVEETTTLQLKAKKELENAQRAVEPLRREAETLRGQISTLNERVELAEREGARLRLQLAEMEGARTESSDDNLQEAPPQAQYFSGNKRVEPVSDADSTTEDLLSFFNLRQN